MTFSLKQIALRTIALESQSISGLSQYINDDFEKAVNAITNCKGRLVISGIGKSAVIAQKIVATLNSTGTPSIFMHAADAIHGDLGIVQQDDVVMINNVVHHFTVEQNKELAKKIARALKPDGIYIIGEFIRAEKPGEGGAVGATSGLYFSIISASGNWSLSEMQSWQQDAGLVPRKPISTITIPGWKMLPANNTKSHGHD